MMAKVLCILGLLWCACIEPMAATAGGVRLATNGMAHYRLFALGPDAETSFASAELGRYLRQMSGAEFQLTDTWGGRSIVLASVGSLDLAPPHKALRHPALPAAGSEAFLITTHGEHVFLIGGNQRGLLYAVYRFLEALGCRWVAPGFDFYDGRACFVPSGDVLVYAHSRDIDERPVLAYRKLYIEEGRSHDLENLIQLLDWMPKARFNVLVAPIDYQGHGRVRWDNWRDRLVPELARRGIVIEVGGHGYQNFLHAEMEGGQLFARHPEWFGMDEEGRRTAIPRYVFCTSNPAALAYLQNNISAYLDARPEIAIFDFWPPDSERWCTCSDCGSMGTPTDRHAMLVSSTARYLRRRHPGVRLECLAYLQYTKPLDKATLDSTVLLDFCPIDQSFEYQIYDRASANNQRYNDYLRAWLEGFGGDVSIYSYFRKYAWRSLPNIIPHYMQRDLAYYREIGAKGISVYAEPGDWFTYGVNHYVLGALAWDPGVDVDSLVRAYCETVYGDAARLAAHVYAELEDIVRYACNIRFSAPKTAFEYGAYIDRLDACSAQVDDAMGVHAADPVTSGHLRRLGLMLAYATASARVKLLEVRNDHAEAERVSQRMQDTLQANRQAGVFIVRRQS